MSKIVEYNTPPVPDTLTEVMQPVKLFLRMIPYAIELWMTDEEFKKLNTAVNNKDSVSGTLELDHIVATQKVQQFAKDKGDALVAEVPLRVAKNSYTHTRKHLGIDITTRRKVGGPAITYDDGNNTAAE
jgi:hypothetical protein